MASFHSLCETHGILHQNTVPSVKEILVKQDKVPYQTRFGTDGKIHPPIAAKKKLCFFPEKAVRLWNMIPGDLRDVRKKSTFSHKLKSWIKENIPI